MGTGIGRILLFLFIFLAEAPEKSGASAQSVNPDELSGLIKQIKDKNVAPTDSATRSGTDNGGISDILSLISEDNNDSIQSVQSDASSILDKIITDISRHDAGTSSVTVLDFMTNAYIQHDFYQTGNWDDAEDFSYITDNIVLPEYNPDDFYRPVWGKITSTFGYRTAFKRMHKGIDLALNVGDTVRAALPGVVARVGYDPGGYGHYVVALHNNGMETRYAHLKCAILSPGDRIEAGTPLGLGGNTGNSTGPHLHFEIRYRGTAVDPSTVFDFSRRSLKIAHKK